VVVLVEPPISFIFNMKNDCRTEVKEENHLGCRQVRLVNTRVVEAEGRDMVDK
jgi:hypothetical protein